MISQVLVGWECPENQAGPDRTKPNWDPPNQQPGPHRTNCPCPSLQQGQEIPILFSTSYTPDRTYRISKPLCGLITAASGALTTRARPFRQSPADSVLQLRGSKVETPRIVRHDRFRILEFDDIWSLATDVQLHHLGKSGADDRTYQAKRLQAISGTETLPGTGVFR